MDPNSDNRGVIDNILREYNVEGASYQTNTYQTSPGQQVTIEKKTTTFESSFPLTLFLLILFLLGQATTSSTNTIPPR